MVIRASDFAFDLPVRVDTLHAFAAAIEKLPTLFGRWVLRRHAAAPLAD